MPSASDRGTTQKFQGEREGAGKPARPTGREVMDRPPRESRRHGRPIGRPPRGRFTQPASPSILSVSSRGWSITPGRGQASPRIRSHGVGEEKGRIVESRFGGNWGRPWPGWSFPWSRWSWRTSTFSCSVSAARPVRLEMAVVGPPARSAGGIWLPRRARPWTSRDADDPTRRRWRRPFARTRGLGRGRSLDRPPVLDRGLLPFISFWNPFSNSWPDGSPASWHPAWPQGFEATWAYWALSWAGLIAVFGTLAYGWLWPARAALRRAARSVSGVARCTAASSRRSHSSARCSGASGRSRRRGGATSSIPA